VIVLPFCDHTLIRFTSLRTGETMFEARMFSGCLIVWGEHYRPPEFDAALADDGHTVTLADTLRDSRGAVLTFGETLEIHAGYSVEMGELPADYDRSGRGTALNRRSARMRSRRVSYSPAREGGSP
jgi:hypothetical protein